MTKWIKKDDEVIVIAGDDKGITGKIKSVNRKKNRVVMAVAGNVGAKYLASFLVINHLSLLLFLKSS